MYVVGVGRPCGAAPTPLTGMTFTVPNTSSLRSGCNSNEFHLVAGLELQELYVTRVRKNLLDRINLLIQKKNAIAKEVDVLDGQRAKLNLSKVQFSAERKAIERKIQDLVAEFTKQSQVFFEIAWKAVNLLFDSTICNFDLFE